MGTDVITRSFDFARTGANTAETHLTPAAVGTRGVKQVLTLQTSDDPRLEAQPLYLSAINIKGKTRNVVYQATMGNTVYAWDADTGDLLWKTNVGTPIQGEQAIDSHNINLKWGIMSTPVIDREAGVLYACAWVSPDHSGHWQTGEHFVVALDITTGGNAPGKAPVSLDGTTFDPGHGLPPLQFRSIERKQRAALALVEGGCDHLLRHDPRDREKRTRMGDRGRHSQVGSRCDVVFHGSRHWRRNLDVRRRPGYSERRFNLGRDRQRRLRRGSGFR